MDRFALIRCWPVTWFVAASLFPNPSSAASPSELEFFEGHIRPILVDHCYACHSSQADKVRGGLRVDTREGLLKGGDSGPALVPGAPDQSLLIKAVRYTDENLQMPPKNRKLSARQIADLEQWIRLGAPDPRVAGERAQAAPPARQSTHWAFQRVKCPPLPAVRDPGWEQEPIDAFVLARLEAKGLKPSPRADKRTLLRRVTYDLTGLPPTPQEVDAFVGDDRPGAFAAVVERLLASPRYGERWARHWLDVARYADTKGYVFEEERRYPYAYTYRDYVIRAFNEDLPYDRFILEQIAADQVATGDDKRPLAALGFLTLGRRFLNNAHDIIDDRIDVVTRGMMGLTVGCARCHDHKFDPITTQDYYALYGVFASSSEPEEEPLLGTKALPPGYPDYLAEHQRRAQELHSFQSSKDAEVQSHVRRQAGEYMLAAYEAERLQDPSKAENLARERKLDPHTVQRWVEKLAEWRRVPSHPIFGPWFVLTECADDQDGALDEDRLAGVGKLLPMPGALNPMVAEAFGHSRPKSVSEAAARYSDLFAGVEQDWQATRRITAGNAVPEGSQAPQGFQDAASEELRQILYGPGSPAIVPETELTKLYDVPSIQKLRALKRKLEELDATHPGAPPRAMALRDNATPVTPHVLIRGNPANPGPEVPRRFVAVLSDGAPRAFTKGSGRLELAEAIASRANPLTARVLVNRVWLHYFGAGLVRTPSDFGLRSEPPTHPELLDYLAARFMDEGWSLKKLHRWIVLSSTYQQASDNNPEAAQVDPGNQLLWKMNRRRLDFEATRDSLLAVAGRLNMSVGGHSVDLLTEPFSTRRTVYGFVERQNLPGLFRTFDFASPDTTSPQRFSTTVPQQALFMINSPFVVQQARELAARRELAATLSPEQRVRSLYRLAFQRAPTSTELKLGLEYLSAQEQARSCSSEEGASNGGHSDSNNQQNAADAPSLSLNAWERYAQVLLMANELVFVD